MVEPGSPLPEGKIYNSNMTMLSARLRELGITPFYMEAVKDDPHIMAEKLKESIKLRCRVRHKKLQPTPQYRDEGCYASVVPPGLQRRKNKIQQHCRFVSALTPQVRSALRRKLRGGSAVLPRESLAPNGFLSEGRNGRHWPFHRYFPFYRLIICRFVPLVN